jgi:hypothetical protein
MIKRAMRAAALAAAVLSVAAVGACGGDDDDAGGSGGETRTGGSITLSQTSQPDFLDPSLGYTVTPSRPSGSSTRRRSPIPARRAMQARS